MHRDLIDPVRWFLALCGILILILSLLFELESNRRISNDHLALFWQATALAHRWSPFVLGITLLVQFSIPLNRSLAWAIACESLTIGLLRMLAEFGDSSRILLSNPFFGYWDWSGPLFSHPTTNILWGRLINLSVILLVSSAFSRWSHLESKATLFSTRFGVGLAALLLVRGLLTVLEGNSVLYDLRLQSPYLPFWAAWSSALACAFLSIFSVRIPSWKEVLLIAIVLAGLGWVSCSFWDKLGERLDSLTLLIDVLVDFALMLSVIWVFRLRDESTPLTLDV